MYDSAADLPDLGLVAEGHYMGTPSYLVKPAGQRIAVAKAPQKAGGVLYEIGFVKNSTAIALRPSGRFGRKTLIRGSIPASAIRLPWLWRGSCGGR